MIKVTIQENGSITEVFADSWDEIFIKLPEWRKAEEKIEQAQSKKNKNKKNTTIKEDGENGSN